MLCAHARVCWPCKCHDVESGYQHRVKKKNGINNRRGRLTFWATLDKVQREKRSIRNADAHTFLFHPPPSFSLPSSLFPLFPLPALSITLFPLFPPSLYLYSIFLPLSFSPFLALSLHPHIPLTFHLSFSHVHLSASLVISPPKLFISVSLYPSCLTYTWQWKGPGHCTAGGRHLSTDHTVTHSRPQPPS